ncbi:hypothetical protein NDU88_002037 [Pleurodeles waltl]|uniref:Uncharacterized protein n=1 Tax=Pleurodeles waltl TaxID=8319 RepID=A0AAV7MQG4_PLEWA|nr:hypothetical protein NDU88_002037 [Pleurodeles waltl]
MVKSGAVYPTSWEAARHGALGQGDDPVFDVGPSTSRGASASLERVEEELLDEEVGEHVAPVPRGHSMEMPRFVRKVVQGDHFGGRRWELVAGREALDVFRLIIARIFQVGTCSPGWFLFIGFAIACGFEDVN